MTKDKTDSIPYRGFAKDPGGTAPQSVPAISYQSPTPVKLAPLTLKTRFMNLFSPRQTDMNQLIRKLEVQFEELQIEVLKYQYDNKSENEPSEDSSHPVNSPNVSHEVHFVGRSALDSNIIQLSRFLISHDMFGAITELWLSNNLISDTGAESLASYLELPRCPIQELWLGQNNIGPNGTALIAAALSSNKKSKLKCLGLNQNPIENAGAGCLAQMLRNNHTLITVDVHGCVYDGESDDNMMEEYDYKVVKMSDGKEYVARVDTSTEEKRVGYVTDMRLVDAIATFSAFNKIDPTREQAIKGFMLRNSRMKAAVAKAAEESGVTNANIDEDKDTMVSSFLSHLCNLPSTDKLTDEEKKRWKECEWERLYVEIERARVARSALASRLQIGKSESVDNLGQEGDDTCEIGDDHEEEILGELGVEKEERLGRDLDDEVVRTEARKWRDLKMGIAGSSKVSHHENRSVKKSEVTSATVASTNQFIDVRSQDD